MTPNARKRRIRVLHIHGGAIHDGASEHILTLARALLSFPVEPKLAVLKDGMVRVKAHEANVPIMRVKRAFRGDPSVILRLAGLIRREHIDVVHTHTVNSNFYGRFAALIARRPAIVTTVHTDLPAVISDDYPNTLMRAAVLAMNSFMNRYAARLITVSETMRRNMVEWGIAPDRISVIYNGVDTQAVRCENFAGAETRQSLGVTDADEIIIGAAGRLVPVKNFDMFLRAARAVLDRGLCARFILVGDGPQRDYLEKLAAELGLREKLVFLGWRGDLARVLSALDICVITSKTETTSLVALQAMALSKPVVATNVASLPEIVAHGKTGLLTELDDVSGLADSLERLIRDRELREQLGRNARTRVKNRFDIHRMAEETYQVYEQALTARRHN
ncbi:MAG: glycosyltransferase family 4 protein [Candidatus Abyssubacteria bacterium]